MRRCIVQGCNSGFMRDRRIRKAKGLRNCAFFKVPKCHTRRQLWEDVFKQKLKDNDYVCDLHFLDENIVKGTSFVINGESIFMENGRWHLSDNAIPVEKKKDQSTCQREHLVSDSGLKQVSVIPPLVPLKSIKGKTSINSDITVKEEIETSFLDVNSLDNFNGDFFSNNQPSVQKNVAVNQTNSKNVNNLNNKSAGPPPLKLLGNKSLNSQNNNIVRIFRKVPKATVPRILSQRNFLNVNNNIGNKVFKLSGIKNHVTSPVKKCIKARQDVNNAKNISKTFDPLAEAYAVEHEYALNNLPRPIFCTNTVNIDPKSLELPTTWGVTEKFIQDKKYLLFTRVSTEIVEDQETEVLQKYVLLDCTEKNAGYFVYGLKVKNVTNLPEIIHSTDILLRTLKIFEGMRICEGLGSINPSLIRKSEKSEVLRDSANILRHANCPRLTKSRTCILCRKLKRLMSGRSATVNRGGTVSKEIFNKLKYQLAREKRLRATVLEQKKRLLKELFEKRREIASAVKYKVSFENICLQHEILNNHKLALREILEASKVSPRGRRYSDEWLMFCASVGLRSPSTYEFLMKTDVIPLPSLRTIRGYFCGKNPKSNFDKNFIDLLKKYKCKDTQQDSETLISENDCNNFFQLNES